jgi:hypothetical protein
MSTVVAVERTKDQCWAQDDDRQGVAMPLSRLLARIAAYLRAGYPEGVLASDYVPLLGLLRRRLSDDEVLAVATELMSTAPTPVEATEGTGRVERHLTAAGWPVTDSLGFLG